MLSYKWVKREGSRVRLYRLVSDLMGNVIDQQYYSFEWYVPVPEDTNSYYEKLYTYIENGGKV